MSSPVILGASGWQTLFDYGVSGGQRVRVTMGPATTIDTQVAALKAAYAVESFDVSVSPGSAAATVRITYGASGTLPAGERRWPVYSLYPAMVSVDLKAHPELDTIAADMPKIDDLVAKGEIDAIKTTYAANALALKYARLVLAGVTTYEAPSHILAVTRHYSSAPSIASDYAAINTVFAWDDIKTDGKSIPSSISEPKYVDAAGTAHGYEWRLVFVAPVIQRGAENTVQWQFQAQERCAKWLYKGGTWEPESL